MAGGSSGLGPYVIVVGDPCSEFVRAAIRLAGEYQVDAVQCDDVYSAVASTAGSAGRRTLIVGKMKELARENGTFFQIAAAGAIRCCCLFEHRGRAEQEGLLAALRVGASIVGDAWEIRIVFDDWLANAQGRPRRLTARDLLADDLRATDAELSALLGHQIDG